MASTRKRSAGLLLYRRRDGDRIEVLLVHPGGPFWAGRDAGAWSVPKGEYEAEEDPRLAARREFQEELGTPAPDSDELDLGEVRQRSGKIVSAWAIEGDLDASRIVSNTCLVQWPPGSGKQIEVPEVDRAEWFELEQAQEKINDAQVALLERLKIALRASP
jgi:predicted NUDIX family NTP pyrophosphohydrolase